MPYPIKEIKPSLTASLNAIENSIYKNVSELEVNIWKTAEPVPYELRTSGEKKNVAIGEKWGDLWDCAWFNLTGSIPLNAAGKKVVLLIDVNGEACIYNHEGCPIQGLTNVNSEFDYSLGRPGKRVVNITDCAIGNEKIDIWADAGCNDLFGYYREKGSLKEAHIAICNEEMRQLYFDFEVLLELMNNLPENSARANSIMYTLNKAALILNEFDDKEAGSARKILSKELQKKGGDSSLSISAIGHAHIDLAWLWPIRETKRKGFRTFSTALMMMERYPDYVFGASQPQLYQWIKEGSPILYSKISKRIEEGRWEAQGGMWVEADTNISGGEALIRQVLYGKRFFKKEFNKDMKILWLPDVFGYSGALPQILKKSGIDYFMTIKLSWNVHSVFPHHTFLWTGIDGSKVLAHMPPEGTYNSPAAPRTIKRAENEYLDKGVSEDCLMLFGIGDGGGGPGEEHLERLKREKNLEGLIPVIQEPSLEFFKKVENNISEYKSWHGELYLERHQGTYTTQAKNKRFNRKLEISLRELEFIASLACLEGNYEYPQTDIETLWKEVLLYQFHDILPGSSIKRVYDEALERYRIIDGSIKELLSKAYSVITQKNVISSSESSYAVFNTLSWNRKEWLKAGANWFRAEVPSMGCGVISKEQSVFEGLRANKLELENDKLLVSFNLDGTIKRILDKECGREVIAAGMAGNKLDIYDDKGDAWDFSIQYKYKNVGHFELQSSTPFIDGPKAELKQIYSFGTSSIEQNIILMQGSCRLDFVTKVLWNENLKMLRTSFPVNVVTQEATCDIQFGNIKRPTHRNTSIDMAKEEISAHKWVDLSQPDYGVALLNDCKYGYRVNENIIDLNLLRSPDFPGENADRGCHEFTYSLYPHRGNHMEGRVDKAAYELNMPLIVLQGNAKEMEIKTETSFIQIDEDNIIVETVKKAEDSDEIIVRLYEGYGCSTPGVIKFGIKPKTIELVNLMEKKLKDIKCKDSSIIVDFKPFEINTLKIQF
jgi:alpha-mannosidase